MSQVDATARITDVLAVGSRLQNQNTGVAWVSVPLENGTTSKQIFWADTSRWTGQPANLSAIPEGATRTTLGELAGPPSIAERLSYYRLAELAEADHANYLKGFQITGNALGTVGGLLAYGSLLNMAYDASDAYQSGDTARALTLVRDWSLGNVGAALLGAVTFEGMSASPDMAGQARPDGNRHCCGSCYRCQSAGGLSGARIRRGVR